MEIKEKIRRLINGWDLYDEIFMLAEAHILIKEFLINNEFPIQEYKQWLNNQK